MTNKFSLLIKPASALCNLRCKYCFYANISSIREVKSYGRMKPEIADKIIENVFVDLEDGDELTIAFQGGEPTFAGRHFFEHFVDQVKKQTKKVKINYVIQTNGTIINKGWIPLLKDNNFLVGLSIDGGPIYHDLNRVDIAGRGSFYKVMQTKKLFDENKIPYNVLCVLTNELAKHPQKVYRFFRDQHVQYVQFIPCLDDLDAEEKSDFALTPERFASFYQQYYLLWLNELRNGKYQSIKLFDDVFNQFMNDQITACGIDGRCQMQFVVEADSSVYPCDFYALDRYRMGYLKDETLKEILTKPVTFEWLKNPRVMPDYCDTCPFRKICCGGCLRMKDAMYVSKSNNFCGYETILRSIVPNLEEIALLTSSRETSFID